MCAARVNAARGREDGAVRIALWSGPRNISTAMMRAWGNRPDTAVCDEPLYAYYLKETGANHPGRDEVLRAHESDWRRVVAWLTGPVPEGKRIFYQKHMAHHLLPGIDRGWLGELRHAFLIRHPGEMLPSLARIVPSPRLEDTGFPQQVELLEEVTGRRGEVPPILDARDVLEDPRGMLDRLCERLGVAFLAEMLSWPPGGRPTDGVWAPYWYGEVEGTTGFRPYRPREEPLAEALEGLYRQCLPHYERLHALRLCSSDSTRRTGT